MRKLLVCAALLCVAFVRAQGQGGVESEGSTPSFVRLGDAGAEAARLLKSNVSKERAWGAYLVGLHDLEGQTASLVSILEDESLGGGGHEEFVARQAALDALIRLDAEVPSDVLLPLYTSSPDEVLILLAREPEKNGPALLQLFDDDAPTTRWLVVGNLLARTRTRGFAARLLSGLKIEANVYVFDREDDRNFGGGEGYGCGCGCGGGGRDESLPPIGYYHLTADASRGATVVAEGRHTVYYQRTPSVEYCGDCSFRLDLDAVRVEYVADMLRTSEDALGLDASPFREVVCKDARQCLKALAGVRDDLRRSHSNALALLLRDGLLDAAEAAELKPDITLDLTDLREKKTFPLPDKLRGVKLTLTPTYEAEPDASEDDDAPPDAEGEAPQSPPR